jgi:hypothetical protein
VAIAPSIPYDTAESILNEARAISADAATANGLAGDILNDGQPYVFPILQKCYRRLQDELISKGVETYSKYGEIYNITPTQTGNPRINVTISYLGYWDGYRVWPNITLPADMIKPLELWECYPGESAWKPMRPVSDSISSRPTTNRFNVWDFEQDILSMPGSSQTSNLKMKYLLYAPDLTGPNSQALVVHCQSALANKMVAQVSKMLGGLEMAQAFEADAQKDIDMIVNRTARKEAYQAFQRRPFRSRGRGRGRGAY